MKGFAKFLITGLIFILIGATALVIGLGMSGWQMSPNYTDEIWAEQQGTVTHLDIEIDAGEFNIEYFNGDKIEIEYQACDIYTVQIAQSGNKLTVETQLKTPVSFMFKAPKMIVKIPYDTTLEVFDFELNAGTATMNGGTYGVINAEVKAGTFNILGNLRCEELNIDMKAGAVSTSIVNSHNFKLDISAGSAHIGELRCYQTDIHVSAGSVNVTLDGFENNYDTTVNKSAGSCNLQTIYYSEASKILNIDISAGSVNVNFTYR